MEEVSRQIFCPHCNSMLPKSTYYRHRSMYYNVISQCWSSAKFDSLNEEWDLNIEEGETRGETSPEETWNIEDFTNDESVTETISDNSSRTELLGLSQPHG